MAIDSPLRVLIADDHGLYRAGLALLLRDCLGAATVVEAGTFDDALDRLAVVCGLGLALFDLAMPGMGGPQSLSVVKEAYPDLKVAVVSGTEDRALVLSAVAIGLDGYIPKSLPEAEIVKALQLILEGHVYVPRALIAQSVKNNSVPSERHAEASADRGQPSQPERLTPRQRDVLAHVLRGESNKEIARTLDIAEGTVKIHLAALFQHYGVRNRTELAVRAQLASR